MLTRRQKKIRGISCLIVLVLVLSLLAACSNNGGNETGGETPAPAENKDNTKETPANEKPAEEKPANEAKAPFPTDKNFEIKIMSWQGQNPTFWDAYQWAAAEYMKKYPNVKIEHIYQPLFNGGYNKLLDTQFVAKKAPDAMQLFAGWIRDYTNQDYLLKLEPYYNQPNPYSNGEKWIDTFVGGESSFTRVKSLNKYGAISFIPVDGGPGGNPIRPFFFNQKILDDAGVTKLPETWTEFMEACKKIKEAGYIPVAADNKRFLDWIFSWTASQLGEDYLDGFFDPKYSATELRKDKEIVALFTGKVTDKDPIMQDVTKIVKEFSQYWQEGWASMGEQQAQQLFLYNQAAFLLDGEWNFGFYQNNAKALDWNVMRFPMITKELSGHSEEAYPVGGDQMGYGWGLNSELEADPDKLAVVLDFFRYLTSRDVQAEMSRIAVFNPVTNNTPVQDSFKPFLANEKNVLNEPVDAVLYNNAEPGINVSLSQEFLTGRISQDQYLASLYESTKKAALQKITDALDPAIGIPEQIKNAQKSLDDLKAQNAGQTLIDAAQKQLDLLNLKLEFYQQYAAPAL